MTDQDIRQINYEKVKAALAGDLIDEAVNLFLSFHTADQAEVFNRLDDDQRNILLTKLDIDATADLFDELEDDDTLEAASGLTIERLADVLDEMEPDEAADLLGDLPPDQASEALAQMEEPEDVLPLLGYPDETAGGRMTTSFVVLRRQASVQQALQILRQIQPDSSVPYYLFVVGSGKHLVGVIGLRELVVADPETLLEKIMNPDVHYVYADADQEEAARVMARYDLSVLPVVDQEGRIRGVITHDDLIDVLEDEATEDIYRLANVTSSQIEPESPILLQLQGRLPWLFINTGTALIAAWVISNFESIFAQVAVLAVFQSVVAGQGGNAGSQSVAMIVRALALDKIKPSQIWAIMGKQVLVGFIQGLIVGLVVGTGAAIWRSNLYLGLVLGLAMVGNMIIAGIMGTLAPLGLKAIGQDPALSSSVLVTAATDSFGFLIFLSLASHFLPYLK